MPDRPGPPPAGPVLILTPTGRDAEGAALLLERERIESHACATLAALSDVLDDEAGLLLVADEALLNVDLGPLSTRLAALPPWSDLPIIVLSRSGVAARRQAAEMDLQHKLGNVLFLERPLNAITLVSAVKSALRARQRQRQVRDHLAAQVGAAERAAALLEERVRERTLALEVAEAERQLMASALAQAQKMEAVGQLTGGLAHDFNNMLTGIIGSLDLLQTRVAQGRTGQLERYIGIARMGAERAASLTHRLLAFSRRQTLDPRPTVVNQLVTGMHELTRGTIGPQIAIETRLRDDLWVTLCDPHQLENALLNLCINARDAMPDGGRLTIETANVELGVEDAARLREACPGCFVTLAVTDTGSGMPAEVMARAFDPFFTTKPLGQGTGLGLSMIYGFVQQSGGHIQIESVIGEGSTVRLFLPRHEPQEQAPSVGDGAAGARAMAEAPAHEVVLVVDDEPAVRLLVTEVLADLDYTPLEAEDGSSGLRLLQSEGRIDLLVTDVGMPGGMNGRQLADAARRHRPELKVLFITGYAEAALAGDGLLAPGMEVMTKPFAMADLASRIRTMLTPPA